MVRTTRPILISVVLCTWNNAGRLRQTLEAFETVAALRDGAWELLVVDNNSTDRTPEVVESFDDCLPLRYVFEPEQGLSNARNAGVAAARGELIVFTDDDVIPSGRWLRVYEEAYREHPSGFFFGGPVTSRFEGERPDPEVLDLSPWSVQGLDLGTEERPLDRGELFLGANWGCPARYFDRVDTFDPALGLNPSTGTTSAGEESDLILKLSRHGLTGWYLPEAHLEHVVPPEKSRLGHIGERREAVAASSYAFSSSATDASSSFAKGRNVVVRIVLALAKWLFYGTQWLLKHWVGGRWQEPYLRWRSAVGECRGLFGRRG